MQLIMWLFMLGVCLLIGGIITFIKIIWLSVKTITCYLVVKQKPNFLFSPFPILILGLLGFVFGAMIPQKVGAGRSEAAFVASGGLTEEQLAEVYADPTGQSVKVGAPKLNLRSKPSGSASVIKTFDANTVLTVTGPLSGVWAPVEHDGSTGWVLGPFLFMNNGVTQHFFDHSKFPIQATVAEEITANKYLQDGSPIHLQSGTKITVIECIPAMTNVYLNFKYNGEDEIYSLVYPWDEIEFCFR
jgi:hypothetical protein